MGFIPGGGNGNEFPSGPNEVSTYMHALKHGAICGAFNRTCLADHDKQGAGEIILLHVLMVSLFIR